MPTTLQVLHVITIGAGATAVLDAWLLLLKRLGVPTMSFAMLGRWAGHVARGRVRHAPIGQAAPVAHELALGWLIHYAVGMGFAALLVALCGMAWLDRPSFAPALGTGIATVALPLFVMQPAMGSGVAASRTPTPLKNVARSVVNHAVFGYGLYLSAAALAWARA